MESELGMVKQAVESATAGAGVVWEAEVNMVDFWFECEDGFIGSCWCFESLTVETWRNRSNATSNDVGNSVLVKGR